MGACSCIRPNSVMIGSAPEPIYVRSLTAKIAKREQAKSNNPRENKSKIESVTFKCSEPMKEFNLALSHTEIEYWLSGCVLPGLDPRGQIEKKCQDMCFYSQTPESLLLGVYDGHGATGELVVAFCSEFVQNFHQDNVDLMCEDPEKFLIDASNECHKALEESGIDITTSGTTQVLVLIYNDMVYHANLGDSRAILATEQNISYVPKPRTLKKSGLAAQKAAEESKNHVKSIRRYPSIAGLYTVQLTRDQKPEDADELTRLIESGARLERISDQTGKKYGPIRVWKAGQNTPGLAMARSIGDAIGKEIGVTSTPAVKDHPLNNKDDYFVVMASDGIWDVMDNEEVVSFIARYRKKCKKNTGRRASDNVRAGNTTIAHLLCEEARSRWIFIVEAEDVVIDDISCVVFEINTVNEFPIRPVELPAIIQAKAKPQKNPNDKSTELNTPRILSKSVSPEKKRGIPESGNPSPDKMTASFRTPSPTKTQKNPRGGKIVLEPIPGKSPSKR